MKKEIKEFIAEILIVIGAGLGMLIIIVGTVILWGIAIALPFVIVIWIVWKLFFN